MAFKNIYHILYSYQETHPGAVIAIQISTNEFAKVTLDVRSLVDFIFVIFRLFSLPIMCFWSTQMDQLWCGTGSQGMHSGLLSRSVKPV